jgi:hypothetical protein
MANDPDSLVVDFIGGAVAHRFRFGGGRGQALPKAVGKSPKVVDATAGLGRDAFLLASLGSEVTLIERSDEMYRLLAEGMERARAAGGEVAEVIARMTLLHGDAKAYAPATQEFRIGEERDALDTGDCRDGSGFDRSNARGVGLRPQTSGIEMAAKGGPDGGYPCPVAPDHGEIDALRRVYDWMKRWI